MQRLFGLAFLVLAIWVGVTVYSEGVDRAFGGLFAGLVSREPAAPAEGSTPGRAADAFQRAYDASTSRVERQLDRGDQGH